MTDWLETALESVIWIAFFALLFIGFLQLYKRNAGMAVVTTSALAAYYISGRLVGALS